LRSKKSSLEAGRQKRGLPTWKPRTPPCANGWRLPGSRSCRRGWPRTVTTVANRRLATGCGARPRACGSGVGRRRVGNWAPRRDAPVGGDPRRRARSTTCRASLADSRERRSSHEQMPLHRVGRATHMFHSQHMVSVRLYCPPTCIVTIMSETL
jgi:hypothetical protein